MVKMMFRLLVVMFLLQSTWTVAAQYCEHELGLDGIAVSHSSLEHDAIAGTVSDTTALQAGDQTSSNLDSDCAYCHLGAMKSMLPVKVMESAATGVPHPIEISSTYPPVVPRQPERPNWLLAA